MRRMMWIAALAATVGLLWTNSSWACHRGGCGHHRGHHGRGGHGGCHGGGHGGGGYCGGSYMGGCATCGGFVGPYGGGAAYALIGEIGVQTTLIVDLPADAQLTIDGAATVSTSETRVFVSPPLQLGNDYSYTLTATVTRDGEAQSVTQEVTVRAGEETRVTLPIPAGVVAAK
jgi:uncharacterized protein (TIGR03000 family)